MIYQSINNPNSHLTVKERIKPSLPVKILFERNLLQGKILDFGCGLGTDLNFLKSNGFNAIGYDPYYLPEYPKDKYDTIICFYVLNILLPDEQTQVLMSISELLKPSGKAYFAVRRDVKRNGFLYNSKKKARTYQCNVILPFKSRFKTKNMELYEYQHYTIINRGKIEKSPFFSDNNSRNLITESATVFAIYDKFPVNKGHSLVIPKRIVQSYFDLTEKEQIACTFVLNKVKAIIQEKYNPDGFNIGLNIGEVAGQTINHVHIHLIPRYKGDVKNPRGGVRSVIPNKQNY